MYSAHCDEMSDLTVIHIVTSSVEKINSNSLLDKLDEREMTSTGFSDEYEVQIEKQNITRSPR